ncbi:MAG: Gfo/Idh/MocA family oxidoreductase [Lachnospiraceae bacterium]|jgi:predicted dehydrogenase|nr:Gfo/Idh/MocA family oxidoreductase [Lachnospiraceae bacterium]
MFSYAIMGAGFIGTSHGDAIAASDELELAAVIDIDQGKGEAFAAKYGCAWYKTLGEMVAGCGGHSGAGKTGDAACAQRASGSSRLAHSDTDITGDAARGGDNLPDAVIVCLPSYLHEQGVLEALSLGFHVLCEKPFALGVGSAVAMFVAAKKAGRRLMAAQVARYTPQLREIAGMVRGGAFGDLRMGTVKRLGQHPDWSTWHRDPQKSGGGLYDLHIHDLDFLYGMFGMPQSVYAIGWQTPTGCWNHVISNLTWVRDDTGDDGGVVADSDAGNTKIASGLRTQLKDDECIPLVGGGAEAVAGLDNQAENGKRFTSLGGGAEQRTDVFCVSCEACMEMPTGYPFTVGYRIQGDRGGIEYDFKAGFNIHDESRSAYTLFVNADAGQDAQAHGDADAGQDAQAHGDAGRSAKPLPDAGGAAGVFGGGSSVKTLGAGQTGAVPLPEPAGDMFRDELEAFAAAVRSGGPLPIPPDETLGVMRLAECILESLESGQAVECGPPPPKVW